MDQLKPQITHRLKPTLIIKAMPEFDTEKFLNTPIYAFDFQFMISDVKDFLEFAENNIDSQYERELQEIVQQKDLDQFSLDYYEHLEGGINHRFRVSLPLRIRYGALLAFITSVEWSVKLLSMNALFSIPEKLDNTNHTVMVLREFSTRVQLPAQSTIEEYEALVNIRNCIAHSAGILRTYKFKNTLPDSIARLQGFSLENWHIFGNHVCIERNALNPYIDRMRELVINLHQTMDEKGFMRPSNL